VNRNVDVCEIVHLEPETERIISEKTWGRWEEGYVWA
jgi:hypothetical protein